VSYTSTGQPSTQHALYVNDARPGIRRRKSGKGFTYTRADGSRLTEPDVLTRIRSLAIPPAWTDVWICPFADGHIQATGRDAGGRKQYRYHPRFREVRESTKYEHVVAFAGALPLPGQELLQYLDEEGNPQDVTSSDVNANLKEISGKGITAKDFRTWAGTVLAAMALNERCRASTVLRRPSDANASRGRAARDWH
jgi:DNA topoisomerase IB